MGKITKMKTIKTITIGIPAHNEANNIGRLLKSIVSQRGKEYRLEKIIIACDGCTDNTNEVVKKFAVKHKLIKVIQLIDDGKRLGQEGRLNQFYKLNKSDIIATFDADTVLGTKFVLNEIALAFSNKTIGLVGGADTPAKPKNFVQRVAKVWVDIWYESRANFNGGVSVNNHKGCASALNKSFAKHAHIPKGIIGNDDYLYFRAKQLKYSFAFAKKAIVYYTVPSNLKDYFTQTTRFLLAKNTVAKYFGDWVYQEYIIPRNKKIIALFKVFIREPLYFIAAVFFQIILRLFKNKFRDNYDGGFWITATSTK